MTVNQITNLNATISVPITNSDGSVTQDNLISLYACFDQGNQSISIGMSTLDKTNAALAANLSTIQQQFQQFMASVEAQATALGFNVFTSASMTASAS